MIVHPTHKVGRRAGQCDRCLASIGERAILAPCPYAAAKIASMAKREHFKSGGYSTDFTPARQGHRRYLLDRIPVGFWLEVQAKAKREKVSLRGLILTLLSDWLKA